MQRDYLSVGTDWERRRSVSSAISALDIVSAINSSVSSISGSVSTMKSSPPQRVTQVPALQRRQAIRGGQRPRAGTHPMPPLRVPRLDPSGTGQFVGRRVPVNANRDEVFNLIGPSTSATDRPHTANIVGLVSIQGSNGVIDAEQSPQPSQERRRSSLSRLVELVSNSLPKSLSSWKKRPTFEDYRREVAENDKVVAERRKVDGFTGCIRPNREVYRPNDIKQKRQAPTQETSPPPPPKDPGYLPRRPVAALIRPEQNVIPAPTLRRQAGRARLRPRSVDKNAKHGCRVRFTE